MENRQAERNTSASAEQLRVWLHHRRVQDNGVWAGSGEDLGVGSAAGALLALLVGRLLLRALGRALRLSPPRRIRRLQSTHLHIFGIRVILHGGMVANLCFRPLFIMVKSLQEAT